jgi:hypothetical protein
MRIASRITTSAVAAAPLLLLALATALGGCVSDQDLATVGEYGGYTTVQYEGLFAGRRPMQAVDFSTQRRVINDDDFAALFPALKEISPRRINLGGQRISDRTIDLLNQLPYLRVVNLEGTDVTPAGWGRLRLSVWD